MFSYQTNRIINGICEYCGIPATSCEHYKNGEQKPLDEITKLEISTGAPIYKNAFVPPLDESEKAGSMAEAKEKMEDMVKKEAQPEVTPETVSEEKPVKKPRSKKSV